MKQHMKGDEADPESSWASESCGELALPSCFIDVVRGTGWVGSSWTGPRNQSEKTAAAKLSELEVVQDLGRELWKVIQMSSKPPEQTCCNSSAQESM